MGSQYERWGWLFSKNPNRSRGMPLYIGCGIIAATLIMVLLALICYWSVGVN